MRRIASTVLPLGWRSSPAADITVGGSLFAITFYDIDPVTVSRARGPRRG
jgi:hypothetical protein